MPQLSDTMTEAKILVWRKKVGEKCARGDILAEVETDKANLEIECFVEGYLSQILYEEGAMVKVGEVIAKISDSMTTEAIVSQPTKTTTGQSAGSDSLETSPGRARTADLNEEHSAKPTALNQPVSASHHSTPAKSGVIQESTEYRVKASPLAKRIAKEQGLQLTGLQGSGPEGRIVAKDLEIISHSSGGGLNTSNGTQTLGDFQNNRVPQPVRESSEPGSQRIELSKMRRAIAQGMVKSFSEIPHFYLKTSVVVDRLIEFRNNLKTLPAFERLTYTHLILKALGIAIKEIDIFNSKLEADTLIRFDDVDVGIVVGVEDGLLVPIVKAVDKCSLHDLVTSADNLVNRARQKRLSPQDLNGGCFAISNLGMFDVEEFSAIIYPGHTGILAVSAIAKQPVIENDLIVVRNVMRLTLSVDHRVADGIAGAKLLSKVKTFLEKPELLLA